MAAAQEIDLRRIALDDGIYVIRVSIKLTPFQVTVRNRDRWMVEDKRHQAGNPIFTFPRSHLAKSFEMLAYEDAGWFGCRGTDRIQSDKRLRQGGNVTWSR